MFSLWYWPIMNAHTKQQQDKVFETDFIDSQTSDPPFAHLLALMMCIRHQDLKNAYAVCAYVLIMHILHSLRTV